MAAKITLGLIARNAEATLQACLESAAPYVDEIIIGLAGESTDDTREIALTFHTSAEVDVFDIPWHDDFSRARNEVLERATGQVFLWLDSDDILEGGEHLREYLDANPRANCFLAPYVYDMDERGEVTTHLWRERMVAGPGWGWEGAIHEYLKIVDPSVPLVTVQMPNVVVRHNPLRNKNKGDRNLQILYRELERQEPDPEQRTLLYLFRENASRGNLAEALLHGNRMVARSAWDDEAYQVAVGIADVLRAQRRYPEARKGAQKAIEMNPAWPDAWFLLARIAYETGSPAEAIEWIKAGSTKEPPQTSLIIDPRTYHYWPYYFLGLSYRAMGDWQLARDNLLIAAKAIPDEQIANLIDETDQNLARDKVLNAFLTVHEYLGRNDEWLKARHIFRQVPKVLENHPEITRRHLNTLKSTDHVTDPQIMIDFYRNNPDWAPMDDEYMWTQEWADHPRVAFARQQVTCDPPAVVLDLGSSDGFISLLLAAEGHIVEGYDLDPRCVEVANRRAQERGLRARYHEGSIDQVEGKYDVALAFEIIEHLVDPAAFLDRLDGHASKVVITTPHLAWNGGRLDDWDSVEPKGHLRIFDLTDIESLLAHRGRVFDLRRVQYGAGAWIFASYRPRQTYAGTVAFLAPGTIEEWSPAKLQAEGLGGSETALIRLAEELFIADGDYEKSQLCTVYGRIDEPGYYNGVRYRNVDTFRPEVGVDVLVAWRYPEAADLATRAKRLILWMHDTDAGDRLTPVRAARFDSIVVLSEWHKAHMLSVYPWLDADKLVIIGNGVDVARFESSLPAGRGTKRSALQSGQRPKRDKPQREPHRVAYTSSPDRGLDVVLEHVWPKVVEAVPDAELHIYYGWDNFKVLEAVRPDLAAFRQKVANLLIDSKNIVQHGRIPQGELAAELEKTSVWLYPSHNFDETYCISAVEAQLAGVIPVTSNRGALAETVATGIVIEGTMSADNDVASQYAEAVVQILTGDQKTVAQLRRKVRASAPAVNWSARAGEWRAKVLD